MKLCIISGSHRSNSQSARVANELVQLESVRSKFDQVEIIDLHEMNLPLWDEGVWSSTPAWDKWGGVSASLEESDAFIFVTPEWGGMAPPGLKNFFLLCGLEELGHKPALIVSISSSKGGSTPVLELRGTTYKNNHICFIPDHIILRYVDRDAASLIDAENIHIFDYHVILLAEYSKSLLAVRNSGVIDVDRFRYGMS